MRVIFWSVIQISTLPDGQIPNVFYQKMAVETLFACLVKATSMKSVCPEVDCSLGIRESHACSLASRSRFCLKDRGGLENCLKADFQKEARRCFQSRYKKVHVSRHHNDNFERLSKHQKLR